MLKKKILVKQQEHVPMKPHPGVEVTHGHGGFCVCELCFPLRLKPTRAGRIAALSSQLEAMLADDDDGPDTIP